MTNPEYCEKEIKSLEDKIHNTMEVWLDETTTRRKRVTYYRSISQSKLGTDVALTFRIENEKKLDK